MPYLCLTSPVGRITLFEEGGHLVSLEWGHAPEPSSSSLLDEAARQLAAYFEGRLRIFDLPLALAGTPFQLRAWEALRAIPYGQTRSYAFIARALGSAPRAVGGACARNPIPILVPCHRVLGADGSLGGYSGGAGVETKRALLHLEASAPVASHPLP
jgi:methylated-DNA-[protein]-cysteine S-methyltransferase